MAELVSEYTINNIQLKLYSNMLDIILPGEQPIRINFEDLMRHDSQILYEHSELNFSNNFTIIIRKTTMNGVDDYKLTIYRLTEDNIEAIVDDAISREFYDNFFTLIRNYVVSVTDNNNNIPLPPTQYPNNGQRNNRRISAISKNATSYETIENGANMVNFHGEFGHGRYYTKNTFNQLQSHIYSGKKKNPFTQQNIEPGNVVRYRAIKPRLHIESDTDGIVFTIPGKSEIILPFNKIVKEDSFNIPHDGILLKIAWKDTNSFHIFNDGLYKLEIRLSGEAPLIIEINEETYKDMDEIFKPILGQSAAVGGRRRRVRKTKKRRINKKKMTRKR